VRVGWNRHLSNGDASFGGAIQADFICFKNHRSSTNKSISAPMHFQGTRVRVLPSYINDEVTYTDYSGDHADRAAVSFQSRSLLYVDFDIA
jgi:hypothetical protein